MYLITREYNAEYGPQRFLLISHESVKSNDVDDKIAYDGFMKKNNGHPMGFIEISTRSVLEHKIMKTVESLFIIEETTRESDMYIHTCVEVKVEPINKLNFKKFLEFLAKKGCLRIFSVIPFPSD
jgi:hypothetical protein